MLESGNSSAEAPEENPIPAVSADIAAARGGGLSTNSCAAYHWASPFDPPGR